MKASDFGPSAWVQVVRARAGHDVGIPRDLPPPAEFSSDMVAALSAADRAVGQLAGIMRSLPNPRLLIQSFIGREAVLSSRIEGTQASLSDLFLFEVSPTIEDRVPDVREVRNYVLALEHGLRRLRQIPLSLNLIRELHAILMQGVRGSDRHPGEFRRVQNWIGRPGTPIEDATYVPPPPDRLATVLNGLERFINTPSDLPILMRVAMVHYQFEAIHPFEDGNGRVGRLLISLMLDSARALPHPVLYLSVYFQQHQTEYYRRLNAVSREGDWAAWISFALRGMTQQAIDAVERAAILVSLRTEWAAQCQRARASALLGRLVDQLFQNPYVTLASATDLLGTRPQSAQNNIQHLIDLGILTEITGQRRNRVYAARRVLEVLEQTPAFDRPGSSHRVELTGQEGGEA